MQHLVRWIKSRVTSFKERTMGIRALVPSTIRLLSPGQREMAIVKVEDIASTAVSSSLEMAVASRELTLAGKNEYPSSSPLVAMAVDDHPDWSSSLSGSSSHPSTRPYLMVFLPAVVRRAERTGLMIWPEVVLLLTAHFELIFRVETRWSFDVHEPSTVRFKRHLSRSAATTINRQLQVYYPSINCAAVMFVVSSVKVGTICRPLEST